MSSQIPAVFLIAWSIAASASALAQPCALVAGDLTGDSIVGVIDLQCSLLVAQRDMLAAICPVPIMPLPSCVGVAAPGPASPDNPLRPEDVADMNCDQVVDVSDIVLLADATFASSFPLASPTPTGCPSLCLESTTCGDSICGPSESPGGCAADCPGPIEFSMFFPELIDNSEDTTCCVGLLFAGAAEPCEQPCLDLLPPECEAIAMSGEPDGGEFNGVVCAGLAVELCDVCQPAEPDLSSVPCCDIHTIPGIGCTNSACEACVCGANPECCETGWNPLCVASAFSLEFVGSAPCNAVCQCTPLSCTEVAACLLGCASDECANGCLEAAGQGEADPFEACANEGACVGTEGEVDFSCFLSECIDIPSLCSLP